MAEGASREAVERGHEPTDVPVRRLLWWGAALLVFVLAGVAVSIALVERIGALRAGAGGPVTALERADREPPPPRTLSRAPTPRPPPSTYGLVDGRDGIATIPLEEARRLLLSRGWPADCPP